MKKLRGIMAILAATALIFGTVACSDGGGNDNNNNKTPTDQSDPTTGGGGSGTSDPTSGGGGSEGGDEGGSTSLEVVYKAEEITVAEVALMKDSSGSAPSAGATTKLAAGTYSIWGGKGAIVTAKDKMSIQINSGKTTPDSIVSATNMGGVNATAVPVVGANISTLADGSALTNYVVVDTAAAGNTAISLNITLGQSTKTLPAGLSYWVLATDTDGKILAVYDVGDVATTYSNYEKKDISLGTAALGDKVCFGFARGAGSGSLKIHSITLTSEDTTVASMTLSSDKESAKVGEKVTWTLTANNMDVPSTVDVYVDGSGTPFITGAAVTDGKYEMTVKEAWLYTDEDDDPIETTVKVFVKSGDVSSNKVTITFVPADNIPLYSDGTPVNLVSDGFTAEELNYLFAMSDAEMETLVAGRYTDAACTIPVTEGYEGDIYIKLNKTKEELKAMIDAAIAAATKYTVTFDANGGAFAADATTSVEVASGLSVTSDQLATISEPAKTDYTFLGWAASADASEAADLSTIAITDATTFYAVWKSKIYVLTGESGKFSLGKTNVGMIGETANAGGSEYLSVATDNWNSETTIGEYTDAFYNLSGATRNITAKVKGVAGFDLYVKNSNAGRTFTVKIGDGEAETLTHPGSVNGSDIIKFTFNTASTDELSIVIGGGSGSVYPGYIVAYSTAQTIPVETVEITGAPTAAVLIADGSVQLGATVAPARATEKTLTWTSDDTNVATVDSTGKVTFVGAGSAKITATAPSGVKAEVTIVVQAAVVNVTGIVVKDSSDATSGTVNAGDKITLTATVSPDDASNKAVTWTSSNEEVATVADGVVTAVGAGTATITATAADGSGVSGSYAVTVNAVTTATYFVFANGASYSGNATVVGDYFTAGTATWGNAEGFGITASSVTVGKNSGSVYGAYFTGDMSYTAETDGLWVTIPITATEPVELANVTGEFRNNKTDNVQVVIYVDDTLVETIGSSSKIASLKLTNPLSLTAGNHTVKIAVQGKSGKSEKKTGCKLEFNSIVISAGK